MKSKIMCILYRDDNGDILEIVPDYELESSFLGWDDHINNTEFVSKVHYKIVKLEYGFIDDKIKNESEKKNG